MTRPLNPDARVSRRSFLTGAAATGAALALPASRARAFGRARNVAIFGGGMAGLVAAHELIELGYKVDVFEPRRQYGGKARSFGVPGTGSGGRADLPAEHGFRFFPGFYENLTDSMSRIPIRGRRQGALSALRTLGDLDDADGFGLTISMGPDQTWGGALPGHGAPPKPVSAAQLADPNVLVSSVGGALTSLAGAPIADAHAAQATEGPAAELFEFLIKTLAFLTSCEERRHGPWDQISWWDYLDASNKSVWFQNAIVKGTTMDLVAVKPEVCAVSSAGNILDAFTWNLLGLNHNARTAYALRFLDGPTSDVWIDPWVQYLTWRGVRFHSGQALADFTLSGGQLASASVRDDAGTVREVQADWYLAAVPVDRLAPILTQPKLLAADPSLENLNELKTDWMNGMQIYLRRPAKASSSLFLSFDHQWTLSVVAQSQLWKQSIPQAYGDGSVQEVISIDISTWDRPGQTILTKAARDCTKDEVFQEIWTTLKQRLGKLDPAFCDDNLHSWTLDPAIQWSDGTTGTVTNDEPLTVQTVNTWSKRPTGPTGIPNLFVAGDWIRTNANVCCMEGGNEGGRMAARAVVEASGRDPGRIALWDYYMPPQLNWIKDIDRRRLQRGLPNLFEAAAAGHPHTFGEAMQGAVQALTDRTVAA